MDGGQGRRGKEKGGPFYAGLTHHPSCQSAEGGGKGRARREVISTEAGGGGIIKKTGCPYPFNPLTFRAKQSDRRQQR